MPVHRRLRRTRSLRDDAPGGCSWQGDWPGALRVVRAVRLSAICGEGGGDGHVTVLGAALSWVDTLTCKNGLGDRVWA